MRAPLFWKDDNTISTALLPVAALYGWLSHRRMANVVPYKLPMPVICVGNAVVGGAGKTPVALALGALLKAQGKHPHYLSRGYGGTLVGPVQVDPARHTVQEVGDEPLLLAEMLPTWIAKDKVAGGKAAVAAGADLVLMDDGLQNPALHKDVSLLVVDGEYGFGNARLMPAGPLREPLAAAMERASAVLLIGEDVYAVSQHVPPSKLVLRARLEPVAAANALRGQRVIAFAGIARPRKFYRTLQQLDCYIRKMVAYPDHHQFSPADLAFLQSKAKEYGGQLVTTAKDYVRLPAAMRAEVVPVRVEMVFEDPEAILRVVLP